MANIDDAESLLSQLVCDTSPVELPESAISSTVRQACDCIGVSVAASVHPAGEIITNVTRELGGSRQARLLGSGLHTSVVQAAWGNGSLAHLLDYDDTGFSHPTACLLPVALGVGETVGASGHDAMGALVLGYEVFERLAGAARAHEPVLRSRGFHPTSVWGPPAAAAVAGKLLGLDPAQLRVAFGIAASDASGLSQQFGTWSKGVNAGNAARSGVMAALLAKRGYRGDERGITGPYGLYSAIVGEGNYDTSAMAEDLGSRWCIVDPGLSIKPYPACTSTLRAVDAMLLICASDAYAADRVDQIVVHVHPDLLHTLRYFGPNEGFRGKFSLDYTVAAAALDGTLTLESFSDESASRSAFRAMLGRVVLRRHPEWPIASRHDNPIEVTLTDGTVLMESVPAHRGSRLWPLSWDEVRDKFLTCAGQALGHDRAVRAADTLAELASLERVAEAIDVVVADRS